MTSPVNNFGPKTTWRMENSQKFSLLPSSILREFKANLMLISKGNQSWTKIPRVTVLLIRKVAQLTNAVIWLTRSVMWLISAVNLCLRRTSLKEMAKFHLSLELDSCRLIPLQMFQEFTQSLNKIPEISGITMVRHLWTARWKIHQPITTLKTKGSIVTCHMTTKFLRMRRVANTQALEVNTTTR